MTVDEAKALALRVAQQLRALNAGFVLVIEADQGAPGGVWHANGNSSGLANMVRSVLDGVVKIAEPSGCPVCDAAIHDMKSALAALSPSTNRTCH